MTGQIHLTDAALETMLRARAERPIPGGVEAAIAAALAADDPGRRVRPARSRMPRRRAWPLLVAAMLAVGMGGGLVWTAAQQHQATPPSFGSPGPPTPGPSLALVEATPEPSADASPVEACTDLDALAAAAGVGRLPVPVVRPVAARPTNGQLVAMISAADAPWPASAEIARLDPSASEATATAISPVRFDGRGGINLTGSPDGDAVAFSYEFQSANSHRGGPTGTPCGAVIVMAADGSAARQPIHVGLHDGVAWPTWGPDGRLAMVRTAGDRHGLTIWEPATDRVIDLGEPCDDCGILAPPWWTLDGTAVIVTYLDSSCVLTTPPPLDKTAPLVDPQAGHDCGRLAMTDGHGSWRLVPVERGHREWMTVDGWLDARTAVVTEGDPATLTGRPLAVDVATGRTSSADWLETWSPDRTRTVAAHEGSGAFLEVTDQASGKHTRIDLPRSDATDLVPTWSPDSRWLAIQGMYDRGGANAVWVVPADGSQPPRQVLQGEFGPWAWLAATR